MFEVFLPLCLCLRASPLPPPPHIPYIQRKHSSGHTTPLCSLYGILAGHQELSTPDSIVPSFVSSTFTWNIVLDVCVAAVPGTEDGVMSQKFCSSHWAYPGNSAVPPRGPAPIPILTSCFSFVRTWLSHEYSRKPSLTTTVSHHWAELCAPLLWPSSPGVPLAWPLYSVVLSCFRVCLCLTDSLSGLTHLCMPLHSSQHNGVFVSVELMNE